MKFLPLKQTRGMREGGEGAEERHEKARKRGTRAHGREV